MVVVAVVPPSPSWGASSPTAWGTNNAFGAPGVSGSASGGGGGGGGVSSPRGWGGANQPFIPPGVSNSAGGMTSSTAARNLPCFAGSGTGSLVGQSGVPLYGPPLSSGTLSADGLWCALKPDDDACADSTDLWG